MDYLGDIGAPAALALWIATYGFGEEIGWCGFAFHRMASGGWLRAAAIIGVLWGLWHLPYFFYADVGRKSLLAGVRGEANRTTTWVLMLTGDRPVKDDMSRERLGRACAGAGDGHSAIYSLSQLKTPCCLVPSSAEGIFMQSKRAKHGHARIESLKVQNFRALREVVLDKLTPLTVLIGPNGSGKSTVFDALAFLAECFELGLRRAWDKRGRAKELKTRGSHGPVVIEIRYRESDDLPIITYHLAVDERERSPVVVEEWLRWSRRGRGRPFNFLEYREGEGRAISGEEPDEQGQRITIPLHSPDLLAVNALGQFAEHPRVAALRDFITSWYVSYLSADSARGQPEAGPQERLSRSGDNLANVIQYLAERHSDRLAQIFDALRQRVPRVERILVETMPDGRLLLKLKDAPFDEPVLARFASDGTLKMLAYLVLFYDPEPPPFIGIEEPENFLHPRLLPGLAEECRLAGERTQLLVTTHSPFFLNALRPEEVRVLWRDEQGYTRVQRVSDLDRVNEFVEEGALLGWLWMEGQFGVGDPLANEGAPTRPIERNDGRRRANPTREK